MRANMSWSKKSTSFTEPAVELVRQCVAAFRARGVETKRALPDLAPELAMSGRRVRCLFYRDGAPVVLKNEWMSLRYRAGLFLLNEAERLRQLADEYEERGNNLVSGQMEFLWNEQNASPSQRRYA
jgi:hypothetical protein